MSDQDKQAKAKWIRQFFLEHPALFISGLYLFASLIGLFYAWNFLRLFGINVFLYSETGDFLLASLKEPFTWGLTILAVLLVLIDNASSVRVGARNPGKLFRWYGSKRYRQLNYPVIVFLIGVFLYTHGSVTERNIREGKAELLTLQLSDGSPARDLVMLGTTGRFAFFFDHSLEKIFIYPHESILEISKPAPQWRK